MTIRIEAHLDDYDADPEHTTDGQPGFLYQSIYADCTECTDNSRLPKQFPTLEAARIWGEHHAAAHAWRDEWTTGRAADVRYYSDDSGEWGEWVGPEPITYADVRNMYDRLRACLWHQ